MECKTNSGPLVVRLILASVPDTIAIVDEAADGEEALALSTNGRRRRVILMSSYTET